MRFEIESADNLPAWEGNVVGAIVHETVLLLLSYVDD